LIMYITHPTHENIAIRTEVRSFSFKNEHIVTSSNTTVTLKIYLHASGCNLRMLSGKHTKLIYAVRGGERGQSEKDRRMF
jgi:hypothetical protein